MTSIWKAGIFKPYAKKCIYNMKEKIHENKIFFKNELFLAKMCYNNGKPYKIERMFLMLENKFNSLISFCYIDKNPEMELINYSDVETRVIEDDTGE